MARDIEADAVINDKSAAGLRKFEENVRKSGKKVEKDYDTLGKRTGESLLKGIGSFSPKLAKALANGVGDAGKLGGPLLITGIAAALPVLSGLVGAAVTGGAAGAGIIGGIALVSRDSRVKAAGEQLGANLLSGLTARAGSFVQPVLRSIDILEAKFLESGDTIEKIFQNTAKFVEPLTDSLANAGQSLLEGLEIATSRAEPVMDAFGEGIEGTGEAIKSVFDDLSQNGEANALVLDRAFSSLNGTITAIGPVLNGITSAFAAVDKVLPLDGIFGLKRRFDELNEAGTNVGTWVDPASDGAIRVGASMEIAKKDADLYAKALEDNARAAELTADAQASLFSDATKAGAALDAAKKAAKENGETLSVNTQKGRENRESLSQLSDTYNAVRANMVKTGASVTSLNGTLSSQRANFIKVAVSMGASKAQAAALAAQLLKIPSPKPKVTLNTAGVAAQARNARQEIAQIKGKTVSVTINVNASRLAAVEARLARLQNAGYGAAGLSFAATAPGQTSRVGGAAPVQVTSSVAVSLDGQPFRSYTQRAIEVRDQRNAFREKVGKRV